MEVEEGLDTGGVYERAVVPIGPTHHCRRAARRAGRRRARSCSSPVARRPRRAGAAGRRADVRRQDRPGGAAPRLVADRRSSSTGWCALGGAWTTFRGQAAEGPRRVGGRAPAPVTCSTATASGGLRLVTVQPEGKGPMAWRRLGPRAPAPCAGERLGGMNAREVAYRTLLRIDHDGAYANLVLPARSDRTGLDERDRRVRHRAGLRHHPDAPGVRRARRPLRRQRPDARGRARCCASVPTSWPSPACRRTPPSARPSRSRRSAARLRQRRAAPGGDDADGGVADEAVAARATPTGSSAGSPPSSATRRVAALAAMNEPPTVTERADGYIQDEGSQWVAAAVGARPGERVLDVCAAPGGKATAMAGRRVRRRRRRRTRPRRPHRRQPPCLVAP